MRATASDAPRTQKSLSPDRSRVIKARRDAGARGAGRVRAIDEEESGKRTAANDDAGYRELLLDRSLEGDSRHWRMGCVDHFKSGGAYRVFSLLWLPNEIQVIRRRTVCGYIDPYTTARLAKMQERAKGLFGLVEVLEHLAKDDGVKQLGVRRIHDRVIEDILQFKPDGLCCAERFERFSSHVDALLRNIISGQAANLRVLAGKMEQKAMSRTNLQQLRSIRQAIQEDIRKVLKSTAMVVP